LLSVLRGEEEMKIKAPVVLLMLVWLTYSVSASGTESKTSFPKLPRQVVQTAKLLNLPSPKFKELGVVSFNQEKPTTVTYGAEVDVLVQRELDKRLFDISHKYPLRGVYSDEFF